MKGLYLYGGVGTGKTMLMDLFFDQLPSSWRKKRIHFHDYMLDVHSRLQKIFDNIINRDIPWPKIPDEMSYEAYDLIDKLLNDNAVQRLGATGATEVKRHPFFKDINWDTLARQKAMFIPSAEPNDTSYFMSRHIWSAKDDNVGGCSDFDDMTETCSISCSSGSYSNTQDEDGDECGHLAEFSAPTLNVKYSFSNFSFKHLSHLASINYDMVLKNAKEQPDASKQSTPR